MARRYIRGRRYQYRYLPEIDTFHELCEYAVDHPDEGVFDLDNATYYWTELTKNEQKMFWENTLLRVMNDTRNVLDNLNSVMEYKVSWNKYGKNNPRYGLPPECTFL